MNKIVLKRDIVGLANALLAEIETSWNDEQLEELKTKGEAMIEFSHSVNIQSQTEYNEASTFLLNIKKYSAAIEDFFRDFKSSAYDPYKKILEIMRILNTPAEQAQEIIGKKIVDYRRYEKEKQIEEQKKANEVRLKIEEAEKQRLKKQAEKYLAKGNEEKSSELLEKAESIFIPPAITESQVKKTETFENGKLTFVKSWNVSVTDPLLVCKAVANGELPADAIEIDTGKLKKWAQLMGIKSYYKNGLEIITSEKTRGVRQ